MGGEIFRGVKQWELTPGVKFPVFYYDNTSLSAMYTAATSEVKKLLPHPDMRLIEVFPGRCIAAFTAFEYRDTDIGPYNEFSIAFPIAFRKRPAPGVTVALQMRRASYSVYIWQLPVTTEIARKGGVEFYGYPKFLADITFDKGPDSVTCRLAEQGREILSLEGKVLPTQGRKKQSYLTYSVIDDVPITGRALIDALEFARSLDGTGATLTLGDHPIADTLRHLGLSARPMMYEYSPVTEAILFAGKNLLDA